MNRPPTAWIASAVLAVAPAACSSVAPPPSPAERADASCSALQTFEPRVNGLDVAVNGVVRDAVGPLEWDWGDGTHAASFFPARHRYAEPGRYQVRVHRDRNDAPDASREAPCERVIDVRADRDRLPVEQRGNVHGLLLYEPTVDGDVVTIDGFVSEPVTAIHWDWGDGVVDENVGFPASHRYEAPGSYLVHVVTMDDAELVSSATVQVHLR